MTKNEFAAWKAETARSTFNWIIDEIHNGRDGQDLLAFKGGANGSYVMIDQTGKAETGTYRGALPCITDAEFTRTGSQQCNGFEDACQRLIKAIGDRYFLLEFMGIRA